MSKKIKRGQAALEFLTTYGWAFLVILVMISALSYFGVLDPSRFVGDRCIMGSPLTCDTNQFVLRDSGATFLVRNGLNDGILITGITYSSSISQDVTCTNFDDTDPGYEGNWTINRDSTKILTCDFESDDTNHLANAGGKERITFSMTYRTLRDTTGQFEKSINGEIYASVE